ncbi:pimeloyl-ACP methyl ester esterase BioH [Thioalkalivibrio sp. XN8]|uniref:pimeloyl-ACP methyl ester esterase BioH n=1 Tax=Thioalkalivibrio sp. XN8 TaxID=2712863 RepID=UPI0013EAC5D4|nr:pimeloyl-ACP methyl ester esterase BioH [Thioalkalivibrio sp. XN8]NGP52374.1 pimeloyl-ACP methyl ester esterase BioH [Thioalkalivibrio sp. XN8]
MSLHVETRGSGPGLVLLHGWGLNSAIWSPLLPRLEQRFRVVLADLPGHGRSPAGAAAPTLAGWAGAVAAVAPPGSTWLGWSLGGQVAMTAALAGHEPRRLVLVATTPRFVTAPDWPCGVAAGVLRDFAAALGVDHAKTVRDFLSLQLRGDARAASLLRTLRELLANAPLPDPAALAAGLEILAATDLRDRLPALELPTLVVTGARDRLTPAAAGHRLAAALPAARRLEFADAAHAPFLTHPEEFLAGLEEFLDEPEAAA